MNIIKQSFEIINQKNFDTDSIEKQIELAGRVAYKSEHLITEDSHKKFITMLKALGHTSPFEFGTIHLKMTMLEYTQFRSALVYLQMWNNDRICATADTKVYITMNYRTYYEINEVMDLSKWITTEDGPMYPKRITVKIITNRAVSHELVRHRTFSFLQESQRYCNYSKDKFNKELTFIAPVGEMTDKARDVLTKYFDVTEKAYFSLLQESLEPQRARIILPNDIKTEIYMCGFKHQWEQFFKLRDNPKVDPQMYDLAHRLHKVVKLKYRS